VARITESTTIICRIGSLGDPDCARAVVAKGESSAASEPIANHVASAHEAAARSAGRAGRAAFRVLTARIR
jgi:hypothetical protein